MAWVPDERRALAATLAQTDPSADTLCAGWDVKRLLAHLVAREQQPQVLVGDAVARRPPGEEPGLGRLVAGASTPEGYGALLDRFAAGPPSWSPMSWAGEQLNLLEYVIHHEDIRRAGATAPGEVAPRDLPKAEQEAVWKSVRLVGRLATRRSPVGVVLQPPGLDRQVVKKGDPAVSLVGDPVELALYLQGRRAQAEVAVTGPAAAVAAFERFVSA